MASFAQEVEEAGSVANPLVLDPWESHLGEEPVATPDDASAAGYPKLVEEGGVEILIVPGSVMDVLPLPPDYLHLVLVPAH